METESLLPKNQSSPCEWRTRETHQRHQTRYEDGVYANENSQIHTEQPRINGCYGAVNIEDTQIDINLNGTQKSSIPNAYSHISWLSFICCCFPLSMCAVWHSNNVNESIKRGELKKAQVCSDAAFKFTSLAIIYGALFILFVIFLLVFFGFEVSHAV